MGRMIRPDRGDLPEAVAEWMLKAEFDEVDRDRIRELSEKAREGSLTPEEDAELEDYGDVARMLELMKAKAKASLRRSA